MSTMIAIEPFTTALFGLFDETFEKGCDGYLDRGTSLFETLATISSEVASRPVSAHCASLAAQVAHVNLTLVVLEGKMVNKPLLNVDWGEIWRTVGAVTPEQWEASKNELRENYQRVLKLMKDLTWEGKTDFAESLALLVHTAYHLGEIRQALCTLTQGH